MINGESYRGNNPLNPATLTSINRATASLQNGSSESYIANSVVVQR